MMASLIRQFPGSALLRLALLLSCTRQVARAQEPSAPPTPAAVAAPTPGAEAPPAATASRTELDLSERFSRLETAFAELKSKQEAAEAAELLSEDTSLVDSSREVDRSLRLYGFTDFGLDKWFMSDNDDALALTRPTPATTFVFGNLNVYLDATPLDRLRALIEVRLTLAPHGEEIQLGPPLGASYERIDSTSFDFSSPSSQSQLRLGGIYIERAWTEYTFSELFKLQWGMFLNPFGIWNLDHGSPTLISLMLPTMVAGQMFPTRLLGVHLHGSQFFGSWELAYALHVSNGRSPLDFDLSEDKAVGARVYLAKEGDYGRLVLGVSGYVGSYADKLKKINANPDNLLDWVESVHYTEDVLGFDLAFDAGGLRVRSEAALRWVKYQPNEGERVAANDGSIQYLPNRMEWSAYMIAAYRTPWHLEPYVEVEAGSKAMTMPRYTAPANWSDPNLGTVFLSAGLNVELTTHTLFKSQFVWVRAWDKKLEAKRADLPVIFLRVVQSF